MARFPCTRCSQRYSGPQQTAYPTVVAPSMTFSERMRLCPMCFALVVKHPAWELVDIDDTSGVASCGVCGAPDTPIALFCTYYAARADREDLYGRLCNNGCLSGFLEAIWGTEEGVQRALRP